jgi:hypothetical protein
MVISLSWRSSILIRYSLLFCCFLVLSACGQQSDFRHTDLDSPTPIKAKTRYVLKSKSTKPCIPKAPIGDIQFDCQISDEDYAILRKDFALLEESGFQLNGPDAETFRTLGQFPRSSLGLTGKDILLWIQSGIKYVVDVSFESESDPNTIASIISNGLVTERESSRLFFLPGSDQAIELTSQFQGIFRLGSKYFDTSLPAFSAIGTFRRLSAWIHERVHVQGNREAGTYGFTHKECPSTHDKKGKQVCDSWSNGAYGVQAAFLAAISKNYSKLRIPMQNQGIHFHEDGASAAIYRLGTEYQGHILTGASNGDWTPEFP